MEHQSWVELGNSPVPTADGTALASSASIGIISPNSSTNPPFTIPANSLFPGAALRVRASGRHSTTGTPTLTFGLYYGGTGGVALAATAAITCGSGVTNLTWSAMFEVVVRSIGTSGTVMAIGNVTGVGSSIAFAPASAPAVATIDTTAAKTLDLCATWSASSASNTITCHSFLVEALNVNLS